MWLVFILWLVLLFLWAVEAAEQTHDQGELSSREVPIFEARSLAHKVYLRSYPFWGRYSLDCDSANSEPCQRQCEAASTSTTASPTSSTTPSATPTQPEVLQTNSFFKHDLEEQLKGFPSNCVFSVFYHFNRVQVSSATRTSLVHGLGVSLNAIPGFESLRQLKALTITLVSDLKDTSTQGMLQSNTSFDKDNENLLVDHGHRPFTLHSAYFSNDEPAATTWTISPVQSYAASQTGGCLRVSENNQLVGVSGTLTQHQLLQAHHTDDFDPLWVPDTLRFPNARVTTDIEKQAAERETIVTTQAPRRELAAQSDPDPPQTNQIPMRNRVVLTSSTSLQAFDGQELERILQPRYKHLSLTTVCIQISALIPKGTLSTATLSGLLRAFKITGGADAELVHESVGGAKDCRSCYDSGGYWCSVAEPFPADHSYFSPKATISEDLIQIKSRCITKLHLCPGEIKGCKGEFVPVPNFKIPDSHRPYLLSIMWVGAALFTMVAW